MDGEEVFMRRALELAERGRGRVVPNPLVGCVLVQDGAIIAEGWHDHIGGLHAEQMAIADAEVRGIPTTGSTAYITLEPCNHFGRTPPCTEALLWAGITHVVIGAADPNPTVRGGGTAALRAEGVEVDEGLLQDECEEQMLEFMHWCRSKRPHVLLKAAIDSHGRIDGDSELPAERFSSEASLELVHELRAESMAVLVGINTVIRDDPSLTVRGPDIGPREQPLRVVIDPNCRIPSDCALMRDGAAPTLVIHCTETSELNDAHHVERVVLVDDDGDISVARILDMLGDRGVQSLMVEGGADTWRRFLAEEAVDRAHLCRSPFELSGDDGITFSESELSAAGLRRVSVDDVDGDEVSRWQR
uniref:Riboflavin biosynthesis protein (RibD) n=1 Tax=uncultured marine group II/III euryarchaeote AD1000_11_G05 TaxID=1457723 RepID=A0A075FJJ9_9EURY|nr:riboflavin biosynthesis protein (ribD) [uncultured marine group II/III euryarchaeote AD1000_11_G05]